MFTKKAGLVILAVMLVFGIAAVNIYAQSDSQLVGTWVGNLGGAEIRVVFGSDGSYSETALGETATGTYTIQGSKVIIKFSGIAAPKEYDYELSGNALNLTIMGVKIAFSKR